MEILLPFVKASEPVKVHFSRPLGTSPVESARYKLKKHFLLLISRAFDGTVSKLRVVPDCS